MQGVFSAMLSLSFLFAKVESFPQTVTIRQLHGLCLSDLLEGTQNHLIKSAYIIPLCIAYIPVAYPSKNFVHICTKVSVPGAETTTAVRKVPEPLGGNKACRGCPLFGLWLAGLGLSCILSPFLSCVHIKIEPTPGGRVDGQMRSIEI
jgi:hypothetical protein